ncbi:MAG: hypothetical protein ACOC0N_02975 [Chroococcales cyanobacterium]
MKYLIAVVDNRIQAEEAYFALEKDGIPKDQITVMGKGFTTADEFGFLDPNQQARKRAIQMAIWLLPFGFAAGYAFNVLTGIELFDWAGSLGNHIIGGIFGAIAGAMGSVFVGGGIGLSTESGDALPYRNRLNEGKYLVVVKGSDAVKNQATAILRQFKPESPQGYIDPNPTRA